MTHSLISNSNEISILLADGVNYINHFYIHFNINVSNLPCMYTLSTYCSRTNTKFL